MVHNESKLFNQNTEYHIQFSDEVKIDGDRFRAVVYDIATNEKLLFTYKISSEFEKKQLKQNPLVKMTCKVQGNLVEPNPARNENAFNYQEYLKQKQIFWELHVTDWKFESCREGKLNFSDKIKKIRLLGISLIERDFSPETAPIAAALIFGARDLLTEEMIISYQKLGVIHLISISGLHVVLLVGMIFYLGIKMGFVRERLSWILIISLPFYALLTGVTPSVNRSVIMMMMILLVKHLNLSKVLTSLDGLCISFLLLSLWNPQSVYNIGFQLTYIVTFSLLLSSSIISNYHSFIAKITITSYISQVSALPFLLYYFFEIPLLSILANLVFIPIYSFLFLPGLILLFISHFISSNLFQLLSVFLSFFINLSNRLAEISLSFSWSTVAPGRPSILFIILYSVSVLVTFYCLEKGRPLILAILLPWMVMSADLYSSSLSPTGEITFIDVGQGDSIFIKLPYNRGNYLIDTGGTISFPSESWQKKRQKFEVGQDVLVPFLKSKGVDKLDLLVLTHGDMDHIGGGISLLKEIRVKKILIPGVVGEKSAFEEKLFEMAKKQNINVSYVNEGQSWSVQKAEFSILAPSTNYSGDKNDGSIVIFANFGGVKWLFTGDLGKEGEKQLMEKYPHITINVLKVGHHGSRTSTSKEFIRYYSPEYSIISVGKKNRFGHPHSEVLSILEAGGSHIFRTDVNGGITYKFNGKSGTFFQKIP